MIQTTAKPPVVPTNGANATSGPSNRGSKSSKGHKTDNEKISSQTAAAEKASGGGAQHIIPAIPATGKIPYETGVAICEPLGAQHQRDWTKLCEVADRLENKPGLGRIATLQQFADEIHKKYGTLKRRLSVYHACKEAGVHGVLADGALAPHAWDVMQEFEADPAYGAKMLKANPDLKKREARALMEAHRNEDKAADTPDPEERWEKDQRASFREIAAAVLTAISFTAFVGRGGVKPEKERTLVKIVRTMPNLLEDVKRAAEGLLAFYKYMKALLKKYPEDEPEPEHDKPMPKNDGSRGRTRDEDQPQPGAAP
jgi:hypothetical protein